MLDSAPVQFKPSQAVHDNPHSQQVITLSHHFEQPGRCLGFTNGSILHALQHLLSKAIYKQHAAPTDGVGERFQLRLIALPVPGFGPTFALFAALLCWFDLVGVRVVCLQGWSLTSASSMHECGAVVNKQTVRRSFDSFDT